MGQRGFFDRAERTAKLSQMGEPLVGLDERINWQAFWPDLTGVHEKERKSNAGAGPIDVVLMFKLLVLQQLHNLSDDRIEHEHHVNRTGSGVALAFLLMHTSQIRPERFPVDPFI